MAVRARTDKEKPLERRRVVDKSGLPLPTITPPDNEPTAAILSVADHNAILVRGYKRADEIELRLARVLEPILARAGNEAASRFREYVTDHLTASAPGVTSTSTMIALYPRPEEAAALEHAPGEDAENLHVTLAYLGDTEGPLTEVVRGLQAVAANHAPLAGEVTGIGSFADHGDGHPGILLPDVPGLGELRTAVCEAILEAGEEFSRDHGFVPHLTVAYNDDLTFPSRDSYGKPLHFDHLVLARGDEKLAEIPLVGAPPLTASASWTPPAGDELVNVKALVAELHTKTDPIRQALVESVMKPTLEGAGIAFDVTNPLTAKVLAQSGSQITGIAETTQLNAMRIIRESYEQGLSIPDTARAIQGGMRSAAFTRATLIARTETVGAVNGGSLAAARIYQDAAGGAGTMFKQWLTAEGALYPRHEDYEDLDGQTVQMDGTFEVGDDQLEYPGDPAGSPEECCNCRCTLAYTDDPSELTDGSSGSGVDSGGEEAGAIVRDGGDYSNPPGLAVKNASEIATVRDLRDFAELPPVSDGEYDYFTHATRWSDEVPSIEKTGLRPDQAGNVYGSPSPLIRDRGAGYVVFRVPKGIAKESVDVVEADLKYPQATVGEVPASDIVKAVRVVTDSATGFQIREDELAQAVLDGKLTPEEAAGLPTEYRRWLRLPTNAA